MAPPALEDEDYNLVEKNPNEFNITGARILVHYLYKK